MNAARTLLSLGLALSLAGAVIAAMLAISGGHDFVPIVWSILTTTYADELIPRLVIVALLTAGLYAALKPGAAAKPWLRHLPLACAAVGVAAFAVVAAQLELANFRYFPGDGRTLGWEPAEARLQYLTVGYVVAWSQAVLGFAASLMLLTLGSVRRLSSP